MLYATAINHGRRSWCKSTAADALAYNIRLRLYYNKHYDKNSLLKYFLLLLCLYINIFNYLCNLNNLTT